MDDPKDDHTADGFAGADDESEEFDGDFRCCVCLDLMYKPVVLACGHISCFWCVFEAMNAWCESRCPICRYSYNHFPSICWVLHFLLLQLYPKAYKRRESQVADEEKAYGTFSPQCEGYLAGSHCRKEKWLQSAAEGEGKDTLAKDLSEFDKNDAMRIHESSKDEAAENLAFQKDGTHGHNRGSGTYKQVLISDLLCAKCEQLLYRPLVLNCGHVFCEPCIINRCNELSRCPVCQSIHPKGFPKVCLVLEHFLEEHLFEEYAMRKQAVEKLGKLQQGSSSAGSTQASQGAGCSSFPMNDYLHKEFHYGVGCDCCGMYPIVGNRYKCKDCLEEIGFDLCEECYKSSSKLPGRFNQQHKPEHEFQIILQSQIILVTDDKPEDYGPEIPNNVSAGLDSSHDPMPNPEGGDAAPVSSCDDASGDRESIEPTS